MAKVQNYAEILGTLPYPIAVVRLRSEGKRKDERIAFLTRQNEQLIRLLAEKNS